MRQRKPGRTTVVNDEVGVPGGQQSDRLRRVLLSGMMALSDLFSQTRVQKLVPNDLRGRAMGAWTSAVGAAPIGNLEIGALASMFGITIALALHGTALIILAVAILITFHRLRSI